MSKSRNEPPDRAGGGRRAIAFIAPAQTERQADDPASTAADTQHRAEKRTDEPTATAESAPPPPQEIMLRDGAPEGGMKRIVRPG